MTPTEVEEAYQQLKAEEANPGASPIDWVQFNFRTHRWVKKAAMQKAKEMNLSITNYMVYLIMENTGAEFEDME